MLCATSVFNPFLYGVAVQQLYSFYSVYRPTILLVREKTQENVRSKGLKVAYNRKLFTTCLTLLLRQRKIVASCENRTHTFGFLDRRSIH